MTSIEFRSVCSFSSPLSTQRSRRSSAGATASGCSCCLVVAQRGLLFAGLSDGKILAWEIDRNCADRRAKESKARVLEEHKGDVRCLLYVESLCQGVVISGAADRCIKMWDLSDPRTGIQCVQSLYGHGGTVIALEHGSDLLLSSSTDGLLFVWRDASPARLLRFPAYAVRQRLEPQSRAKETWFLSLSMREGEAPTLFAGDSEGYVHIFKLDLTQDKASEQLFLAVWKAKVHELGVSKIMAVPMESFLFTLSHDQKLKAMDSVSGQILFEELNQCNVIFHSLAWDPTSQDVIVCDSKGNLGFYNLIQEIGESRARFLKLPGGSWVAWKKVSEDPIIGVHLLPAISRLVLLTPHSIQVLDIVRGVKFQEIKELRSCHTAPIVAIASRPTSQGGVLYTASMDNTIRMWDSDTLECIKCLKERKQEITAMVYVPRANVVITGHENSDLKMWSLDSHQEACLKTVTGQPVHENTISALILVNVQGESAHEDPTGTGFELVVAASYDRQLSFWRVTLTSDGTAMAKFERVFLAHEDATDEILALGHSPFGSIFSGGNEGIIRQWTIWGGKASEADLIGHEEPATCFRACLRDLVLVDAQFGRLEIHHGDEAPLEPFAALEVSGATLLKEARQWISETDIHTATASEEPEVPKVNVDHFLDVQEPSEESSSSEPTSEAEREKDELLRLLREAKKSSRGFGGKSASSAEPKGKKDAKDNKLTSFALCEGETTKHKSAEASVEFGKFDQNPKRRKGKSHSLKDARDSSSSDTSSEDDKKLRGAARAFRRHRKAQEAMWKKPMKHVRAYIDEVETGLGVDDGDKPYHLWDYTRRIPFGKKTGLFRAHFLVSHILKHLLDDDPEAAALMTWAGL
eukprot:s5728_g3.t1